MAESEEVKILISQSEFDCSLCCRLLFDPVTTPDCGHTFCRECLVRALAVKRFCPLCRCSCTIDATRHPSTSLVVSLLQSYCKQAYDARQKESTVEKRQRKQEYGIFLSNSVHFPGEKLQLHLFEPRYRIMLSRALASNRHFLVVCVNQHQLRDSDSSSASFASSSASSVSSSASSVPPSSSHDDPLDVLHSASSSSASSSAASSSASSSSSSSSFSSASVPQLGAPVFLPPIASQEHYPIVDGDVGVVFRIGSCHTLPDGRSYLEAFGESRVRLAGVRLSEDAYNLFCAEAEPIEDGKAYDEDALMEEEDRLAAEQEEEEEKGKRGEEDTDEKRQEEEAKAEGDDEFLDKGNVLTQRRGKIQQQTRSTRHDTEQTAEEKSHPHPSSSSGSQDSSSSSSSSSSSPSSEAQPVREVLVQQRVDAIQELLLNYLSVIRTNEDSLHRRFGPAPVDPSALSYWVCQLFHDNNESLKLRCLASTDLLERLDICLLLLHQAIAAARRRSKHMTWGAGLLLVLAILYQYFVKDASYYHVFH